MAASFRATVICRRVDDLRPVQASIAQDVIHGLKIDLDARQSAHLLRPVSSSLEAYREMLQGETAARGNSPLALHEAIGHFEHAVKLDPKFTIAWSDLAGMHLLLGLYFEDPRQHMPQASYYATRALESDSGYAEAHGTLGLVKLLYQWNYAGAAAELASAKDEQSALSLLSCTSHLMAQTGRTRDADEMVNRMLGYDPAVGATDRPNWAVSITTAATTRMRCGTIARRWREIRTRRYRIGDWERRCRCRVSMVKR